MNNKVLIMIGIIVFTIFILIFAPLIAIWAVNILFAANIQYTVLNWFASLLLMAFVNGGR